MALSDGLECLAQTTVEGNPAADGKATIIPIGQGEIHPAGERVHNCLLIGGAEMGHVILSLRGMLLEVREQRRFQPTEAYAQFGAQSFRQRMVVSHFSLGKANQRDGG